MFTCEYFHCFYVSHLRDFIESHEVDVICRIDHVRNAKDGVRNFDVIIKIREKFNFTTHPPGIPRLNFEKSSISSIL